jgi:hypothetical protein
MTTNRQSNKRLLAIVISSVVIVLVGIFIGLKLYFNHKNTLAYNANLAKVAKQAKQLDSIYRQYSSLPTSTTQSQSDWDSYYSGLISQIKTINSTTSTTYTQSALNKLNADIETASASFINLLNLDKSATDMQFQIQTDQNQVTTDKGLLQTDIANDNSTCALAATNPYITCDRSLENQANSYLTTANNQLSTDQQTLKNQQSQSAALDFTVAGQISTANIYSAKLLK